MTANAHRRDRWLDDVALSVAQYNEWYVNFAPGAYERARLQTEASVLEALELSDYGRQITPELLARRPGLISVLRMMTAPPLARDRLVGLSGVLKTLVQAMEQDLMLPSRMAQALLRQSLERLAAIIGAMLDAGLLPWLHESRGPTQEELAGALLVLGDRVCRATADPIIRNAQEERQLGVIERVLTARGYRKLPQQGRPGWREYPPGTFGFRVNVQVKDEEGGIINMPIDAVVMPKSGRRLPVLIEAKSAGDFTNVNKRRKEEATKIRQLHHTYGKSLQFVLFLCGYFGEPYLSYEAAEGIDWVWEHRPEDLALLGL